MEWIELKKKKPNPKEWVIVYANKQEDFFCREPQIFVACMKGDCLEDFESAHGDGYIAEEFEITHWMPLPKAPRPVATMFKKEDFEGGSKTGIAKGGYASSGNFDKQDCYTKKIIVNLPENCRHVSIQNMVLEIILDE